MYPTLFATQSVLSLLVFLWSEGEYNAWKMKSHEFNDKAIIILTWELSQSIESKSILPHTISKTVPKSALTFCLKEKERNVCERMMKIWNSSTNRNWNWQLHNNEITPSWERENIFRGNSLFPQKFSFLPHESVYFFVKSLQLIGRACKSINKRQKYQVCSWHLSRGRKEDERSGKM